MNLYIKNMVCDRCKTAVANALKNQHIPFQHIELGEVILQEDLSKEKLAALKNNLEQLGFELIDNKKSKTIEKIKAEIIKAIHQPERKIKINFSSFLAEKIGKDYSSLSSLFSEVEGTTIEQYIIHQKIERAKELLVYDELSLSEIANLLNYSSVAHLSNQFKKVTGLTPSHFKNLRHNTRKPLDKV
ncbi:MAG: helix-turn-helix domain-containing protein [Cyclobacteriaceae bacterium]